MPPDDLNDCRVIRLDRENPVDVAFTVEAYGIEALERGYFREKNRLYIFPEAEPQAAEIAARDELPSILEVPAPPLPDGPLSRHLVTLDDGATVTWVRHPNALPERCRPHWRHHTHLFIIQGREPEYTAYTSIFSYAHVDGADGRFRIFGPGGIRWIDYPDREAAICDALDMSLAVAMKIQVVRTPSAGNKIAVYGDYAHVGPALRSIFAAYERLGIIVTSADLGLSIDQLEEWALPVAPSALVPLGVFRKGIPSAEITADAALAGLEAMAEALAGSPGLGELTFSLQGLGEVGYRLAGLLLGRGARLLVTEANPATIKAFTESHDRAAARGQVVFLDHLDGIYDAPADIFVPCARRDILTETHLARLQAAGVRMIGGPANNLFPDQTAGPWLYHRAGLPVVPYEAIGAGGVTGVAYSIMTGIFGRCPFEPEEKIGLVKEYVGRVLVYSKAYDLPPQVISDRILIRRALRRRLLHQDQSDRLIEEMGRVFAREDPAVEKIWLEEYTKQGFFSGTGRYPNGGWNRN